MNNYLAEFLGAVLFVYVILATGNPLAIGAALALIILLTSNISGGHINPAVSIVMASIGRLPVEDLVPYCLAQIFGGLVALELYKRFKLYIMLLLFIIIDLLIYLLYKIVAKLHQNRSKLHLFFFVLLLSLLVLI